MASSLPISRSLPWANAKTLCFEFNLAPVTLQVVEKYTPERRGKIFDDLLPDVNGQYVIDLSTVSRQFYTGEIGKHLALQDYRYRSRYHLKNNVLRQHAGIDAHPVGHQVLLARHYLDIVIQDGMLGTFTSEQVALARFTALFHEAGESTHKSLKKSGHKPIGDVPHGEKTAKQRKREAKIRHHIFTTEPAFADINHSFLERAEALIGHHPKEGDELIHELIETAHTLQGFDAAMTMRFTHDHAPRFRESSSKTKITLGKMAVKIGNDTLTDLRYRISPTLYETLKDRFSLPRHFVDDTNVRFHERCAPLTLRQHIGHAARFTGSHALNKLEGPPPSSAARMKS